MEDVCYHNAEVESNDRRMEVMEETYQNAGVVVYIGWKLVVELAKTCPCNLQWNVAKYVINKMTDIIIAGETKAQVSNIFISSQKQTVIA